MPYPGYPTAYSGDPVEWFFPRVAIEIGFANNALDEPVTWVNVAKYCTKGKISRGRQHELNRFDAGTMTLTLDNTDGRFSPFNTSSPYSPNVAPFRPIRATGSYGGVTYPLFRGFIEVWQPKWQSASQADVTVRCVDATKLLNLKKVSSADFYQTIVADWVPSAWYRLNDPAGSRTAADSSGNGLTLTADDALAAAIAPSLTWTFQAAGALVADTNTALDTGHHEVTFTGTAPSLTLGTNPVFLEAWVNPRTNWAFGSTIVNLFFVTGGPVFNSLVLGLDATGNAIFQLAGSTFSFLATASVNIASGWHHLVGWVAANGLSAELWVDGVQMATASTTGTPSGTFDHFYVGGSPSLTGPVSGYDGLIDEVAIYTGGGTAAALATANFRAGRYPHETYYTGDQIQFILDRLGWPAALTVLDTGITSTQGFTDALLTQSSLDNMRLQADSEGGQLFVDASGIITFFDRYHTSTAPYTTVQITLGDGTGEEPYLVDSVDPPFDDTDIWNQVVVTPLNYGPQTAADATSQLLYGFRTLSRASVTDDPVEALNQASFFLNQYKDPQQRVKTVAFTPMSDPAVLFPAALGLDVLNRVEFIRRPKDGASSTFDQEALIEGIDHDFTKASWATTWRLSPTDAAARMGIFNESNFGESVFAF